MMECTQNYWDQRDIINKIEILTNRGTDKIHAVILTKYHKYPSTTILKHSDTLAKVNKLPYGRLPYMTPHDAYIIKTHISTVTLADISHKKRSKIPPSNIQDSMENNSIIQLCQNLYVRFN